ncbi:MAG: tRNA pseudouridine(55) synthase TruB [Acidobacteriota bacterium]|nr:tRNA pseudouridine(55) synthase TruB [Acidobacteriota bacterium]
MNGILVIDKPEGFTSHDVVGKVRRALKMRSVGHTGTLDPFATGVLVVLVGKATRLAQFLDKAEKEYLATIQFGFSTDTGDLTGVRIDGRKLLDEEIANRLTKGSLEKVLAKFRGETWQTPPMYSAKKVSGKKLYELARKGVEIERKPVKINISKLEIENNEQQTTNNEQIQIRVVCSAGTYIRVLAEDIGKELGTGAHLAELRRTRAGSFELSQAVTIEELENLATENQVEQILISPNDAVRHLPLVLLDENTVARTLNGMKTNVSSDFNDGEFVRLCDERENLIAVGVFSQQEQIVQPRIVLGAA